MAYLSQAGPSPAFLQRQGLKGPPSNGFCLLGDVYTLTMLAVRIAQGAPSTRGLCGHLDSVVCLLAGPAGG